MDRGIFLGKQIILMFNLGFENLSEILGFQFRSYVFFFYHVKFTHIQKKLHSKSLIDLSVVTESRPPILCFHKNHKDILNTPAVQFNSQKNQ